MVVLRITGPAEMAGIQVIKGNHGSMVSPEAVAEADLVVIQRDFPRFWEEYKQVISLARESGRPVVYELDDLLVEIPENHSHSGDYVGEMLTMLYAIIDADVVTASSPYLVNYLSDLNPNSRLVNNFLNDSLWVMKDPQPVTARDLGVTIGYMGGQTHQADLEGIASALLNVYKKYPDQVNYKFWGVQPPADLLNLPTTEWVAINQEGYAQFASFYAQQDCDILIAPLVDNEFNRAKSCIKYLEYSILGSPGVYSKLPPYEAIVDHGINGYLAESAHDWEVLLSGLVENPTLRHQIAAAAQQTVKDQWLLSQKHHELSEVYQLALEGERQAQSADQSNKHLKRIISYAEDYQADLEERYYAVNNQLTEINNSRSWRLLKQVQNLRLKIIPKGKTVVDEPLGEGESNED